MTGSSETSKKETTTVNVPVTVCIKVPIEIDVPIAADKMEESQEFGCMVVDPTTCKDAAARALVVANQDRVVGEAFQRLVSAAMRFQEQNPGVEIYMTPFAGLVKETKL